MAFKLRITSTALFLKKSDSSTAPINWLFLQRYTAVVSSSNSVSYVLFRIFLFPAISSSFLIFHLTPVPGIISKSFTSFNALFS